MDVWIHARNTNMHTDRPFVYFIYIYLFTLFTRKVCKHVAGFKKKKKDIQAVYAHL